MLWRRDIVGHPGSGEVSRSIWMANLAAGEQILLHFQTGMRIVYAADIMHAVAIVADWLVHLGIRRLFFEERYRLTMKIGDIGVQNIGRQPIFGHQGRVGVAFGANLRRFQAESSRARVADIVNAMTIDAGRHIGIALA